MLSDQSYPIFFKTCELREKGLLEESRGAQVVNLGEDENPALILKSDGSSLYMTRERRPHQHHEQLASY